jgi:hypothetical protein
MPPKDKHDKKSKKVIKHDTDIDTDDSVDSNGNIRDLIDYDYDSEESEELE